MTDFDDMLSGLDSAIEDVFGESAILTPRVPTTYGTPTSDPGRFDVILTGTFSDGPASGYLNGGYPGEFSGKTMMDAMIAEFWVSASGVLAIGYDVKTGDALTLTDKSGVPTYRITEIQRTGEGDMNLVLVLEE